MPLKLLLADDSMTAQNMGKKILSEAGYEIVTVSNGAAAVKKIAELKPDLVILDVYMPGYTGLEVCERVKGAQETASMPVILTVGKMEPFKAEDGNRVHADGVIIKPFEATDLVAAVQKLSAKLAPPPAPEPPVYEQTVKLTMPLEEDASYAEWHSTAEHHVEPGEAPAEKPAPEKIAVPEEMANAAAGFGLLEEAPAPAPERSTVTLEPEAMAAAAEPAFELAMPEPLPMEEAAPLEVAAIAPEPVETPHPDTEELPAIVPSAELETFEPGAPVEEVAPPPELQATAAPAVGEIEAPKPSGFEATAHEEHKIAPMAEIEPLLMTDSTEMASAFPTKFGVEGADHVPVGIASDIPELYANGQAAAAEAPAEEQPLELDLGEETPAAAPAPAADFDGLVAAKLAEETAAPAPTWQAHEEQLEHHEAGVSLEAEMLQAQAAAPAEAGAEPVLEAAPEPLLETAPEPEAEAPAPEPQANVLEEMQRAFADLPVEPAPAEEALPVATGEQEVAAAMAAAAGASASAAVMNVVSTSGTQKLDSVQIAEIADIVHRVTERLKSEIIAEIARELENKKP